MNDKLITRVLETARQNKGKRNLYDPLVSEGYRPHQIDVVVAFCREQGLLASTFRETRGGFEPVDDDQWWANGLTLKGGRYLDDSKT